jgi:uncharacterized protein YbbK (DUF523 family)
VERILVSACLLGVPVRYDGRAKTRDDEILDRWRSEGRLLSCCPEVSGGLPVPRPPAEVAASAASELSGTSPAPAGPAPDRTSGGAGTAGAGSRKDGAAVLDGAARVLTANGVDVTDAFVRGAELALEVAQRNAVRMAVLKEGSPSCGSSRIYDGSFSGQTTAGSGVTTALLNRHGIRVFSEDQLTAAESYLAELESAHR